MLAISGPCSGKESALEREFKWQVSQQGSRAEPRRLHGGWWLGKKVNRQLLAGLKKAGLCFVELVVHVSPDYKLLEVQACVSFIFVSSVLNAVPATEMMLHKYFLSEQMID